ncbi:unnamed protein product, partial [Discosporangium mesarthrocarpum]
DVARLAVTRQIACMVGDNYAFLVGGMRQVQAVDVDLARAAVQAANGRRGLQRGLERGPGAVLALLRLQGRRDRLRATQGTVALALGALSAEAKVGEDLAAGRFAGAVAKAEVLAGVVASEENLCRLEMLRGLGDRAGRILDTVRERAEVTVVGLCQRFSAEGYGEVIRAYLLLEDRKALHPPPPQAPDEDVGVGGGVGRKGSRCLWIAQ